MLVRRLTTILPDMTLAEALDTTHIHSVAGLTGCHITCVTNSRVAPRTWRFEMCIWSACRFAAVFKG
jgi:predicted ATPase with chaperone activity